MVVSSAEIPFSSIGVYQGAWASHPRGSGEELTGPQCGDIGPGHPWGLSFASVLRVSELSDSQYESKTEGESPSPESGY